METLFGTLCLRWEANPARMLQCRELALPGPTAPTPCRSVHRNIADVQVRTAVFRPMADLIPMNGERPVVTDTVEKVFFGRSSKNLRAVQAWQQFSADRVAGFSLSRCGVR